MIFTVKLVIYHYLSWQYTALPCGVLSADSMSQMSVEVATRDIATCERIW